MTVDADARLREAERRDREQRVWSAPQYGIRNGRFVAVDGPGAYRRTTPWHRPDHDNPLFREPPSS